MLFQTVTSRFYSINLEAKRVPVALDFPVASPKNGRPVSDRTQGEPVGFNRESYYAHEQNQGGHHSVTSDEPLR